MIRTPQKQMEFKTEKTIEYTICGQNFRSQIIDLAFASAKTQKGKGSMTKVQEINVKDTTIWTMKVGDSDCICITDIARQKNPWEPKDVVKNWM